MTTTNEIRVGRTLSIAGSEITFRTSRSCGPGGQNVNKLETKVELLFDVKNSPSLSDEQRSRILLNLKNRIDSSGILHLASQTSRSQWENRQRVVSEFVRVLSFAIRPAKKRIATRPSKVAKEERLRKKRIASEKKRMRNIRPEE